MSDDGVREVVERAAAEATFRSLLAEDPDKALQSYRDSQRITDAEANDIKSVKAGIWEGVQDAIVGERRRRWWQPTSYRDVAASALTVVLAIAFVAVLWAVVVKIGTPPTSYVVNGITQSFDSYARAKDIMTVVLPLFSAVLSFWFGVTVEGKRADDAQQQAASAQQQADAANKRTQAVLDASPQTGLLEDARGKYPELFAAWGRSR